MNNDEFLKELQKSRIRKIYNLLKESIINAESEDKCTNEENDMYADMQNLIESIDNYFDVEEF